MMSFHLSWRMAVPLERRSRPKGRRRAGWKLLEAFGGRKKKKGEEVE